MRETDGGAYADILDAPRPVSERHPPMPRKERAAQFAPFAALTGLDESLDEEMRQGGPPEEIVEHIPAED